MYSLYHLTGLVLIELLRRWQVPVFEVVAIGLQFGLKHVSLMVVEEEQKSAQVFIQSVFGHVRIRKEPLLIEEILMHKYWGIKNAAAHSGFVVCISVVSVSSYCWVLQKDQILPLLLWLQPCAIVSRSQWYLVCKLLWGFGQVKRILQQSWWSEEKRSCMRMDQYPPVAVLWSEVPAHRCIPGGAGPAAGSDGTFWAASQPCNVQAECEALLSPRKRGDAVPAVWEAAERVTAGRCTYSYKETICDSGY